MGVMKRKMEDEEVINFATTDGSSSTHSQLDATDVKLVDKIASNRKLCNMIDEERFKRSLSLSSLREKYGRKEGPTSEKKIKVEEGVEQGLQNEAISKYFAENVENQSLEYDTILKYFNENMRENQCQEKNAAYWGMNIHQDALPALRRSTSLPQGTASSKGEGSENTSKPYPCPASLLPLAERHLKSKPPPSQKSSTADSVNISSTEKVDSGDDVIPLEKFKHFPPPQMAAKYDALYNPQEYLAEIPRHIVEEYLNTLTIPSERVNLYNEEQKIKTENVGVGDDGGAVVVDLEAEEWPLVPSQGLKNGGPTSEKEESILHRKLLHYSLPHAVEIAPHALEVDKENIAPATAPHPPSLRCQPERGPEPSPLRCPTPLASTPAVPANESSLHNPPASTSANEGGVSAGASAPPHKQGGHENGVLAEAAVGENSPPENLVEMWGEKETCFCIYEISHNRYVKVSLWRGQLYFHLRDFIKGAKKRYPSGTGVALSIQQWLFLTNLKNEINQACTSSLEGEKINKCWHLGGNKKVSVHSGYKKVDIRQFFLPPDDPELSPSKKGISLSFAEWEKLANILFPEVNEKVPQLKSFIPCMYTPSHATLAGRNKCPECNPDTYRNYLNQKS